MKEEGRREGFRVQEELVNEVNKVGVRKRAPGIPIGPIGPIGPIEVTPGAMKGMEGNEKGRPIRGGPCCRNSPWLMLHTIYKLK